MKSISYVVMVLSVFMVAAAIDAIPDPPAVTPHTVNVKDSCPRGFDGGFREQRLTCDSACISPYVPIQRISRVDATKPKRFSDWIALTGYAADPSPPVL
jgi:hypothetical protein